MFNSSVYIPKVTHDLSQTYICDLRVAKTKHQVTMTTASNDIGTYRYMASEMFGAAHRSMAVDVYSLDCLYIELFGGKRVWEGIMDRMQIMYKVCGSYNNPPKMPEVDHLDPIYGKICKGCCQLDPKKRLQIDDICKSLNDITQFHESQYHILLDKCI